MSEPFRTIGIIHTPFQVSAGTPVQSACANGACGTVEVYPEYAEGLRDLEGFERIWLLYHLDRATAPQLVTHPYLDDQPHGIFATRSPARPNHIGLSPVRLLRVEGALLHVADVDMLDGTPLLDIKPYVAEFDCFAVDRNGWYDGRSARGKVADARFERSKPGSGGR